MTNAEYPENWTPYTPCGNNVIVRPLTQNEIISTGGVIMPQTAGIQKAEGVVLAVGPGIRFEIPSYVWKNFQETIGFLDSEDAESVAASLEEACLPQKPDYEVGDTVFFPPWLAQWETHFGTNLEFCRLDAGQILGRQKVKK